jgi:hypothetical protein
MVPVVAGTGGKSAELNRAPVGDLIIGNNSPWLKRITYFGTSLALINALIITIVICIISMILLLIFILLNMRRMEKERSFISILWKNTRSDHQLPVRK